MIVVPATKNDVDEVVRNLGRTFAADPSLGWVLRKASDPVGIFTAYYDIIVREALEIGNVDVAKEGDDFLGTAVWLPPGVHFSTRSSLKALPLLRHTGTAAPTLLRYLRATTTVKLPFPAWYLAVISVDEKARGKGVGSALLDAGVERFGDDAAMLEATSARAAKLYESRGFFPLGELKTPAPTPEIIMWRPARSTAS